MNKKINHFYKRNINAEKKRQNEWVFKTDMNTNNNKINNCSKQISDNKNKMNDYWTKDQCSQHPHEWFLKANANAMNMQMNYC